MTRQRRNNPIRFRRSVSFWRAAVLMMCTFGFFPDAMANVKSPADESLSINTRYNPDYDPQGIPAKGFTLYPSITNAIKYSDNVYATSIDRIHDYLFTVRPELNIKSDFERHSMNANLFLEKAYYHDITSENYRDYGASINGQFDIVDGTYIPASINFRQEHVRRGSPDEQVSEEPTVYKMVEGTTGFVREGQNVAVKMMAGFKRFVFDNTVGLAGEIDNGDRDRNEYSLYTSVGMAEDAIIAPFIYGDIRDINYDRAFDDNGFNRDAFQYEMGIGTIVNLSDVTRLSFNIGRINRSMEDDQFSDINAMSYGVNLLWEPSTLASFLLEGDRTIEESTLDNISASINSSLRLSMNYELFPNLFVQPSAGYLEREYEGPDAGTLETIDAALQMTYKMNQNLWLTTSYRYINQDEKEPSPELESYESNNYSVSLKMQF